jgi:putative ABC transport system permease protein
MHGLWPDLRYSIRQLAKSPLITAAAIVSLTLGIGANTAIFSLINALVLQSLPIRAPEQLVRLKLADPKNPGRESDLSLAMFQQLQARQSVFSEVFAWSGGGISNIEANGSRYVGSTAVVSGEYFSTLGISPYLGRFIAPSDLALEAGVPAAVAVIDYLCWTQRYASDPAIIGKTIRVEDRPLTIVGVVPKDFHGLMIDVATEVTVPVGFSGRTTYRDRSQLGLEVYGRLKPASSFEQAQAQLKAIWPGVRTDSMPPDLTGARRDQFLARQIALSGAARGSSFLRQVYRRPLFLLMAMVGTLLLIACVNLANLRLARSAARKSEFAIRLALGATRWQLIRQILIESLLLSFAGALTGLLLARQATAYLLSAMWSGFVPLTLSAEPDLRVLAFTALATVTAGIAFSLLPARGVIGLGETSRSVRRGKSSGRVLIPVQVALSLVLVLTALVFVRSLQKLRTAGVGFRNEGMLVIQMFPQAGSESQHPPGRTAYYREIVERVGALPGVEGVSYSHMGPLLRYESKSPVSVTRSPSAPVSAVFELVGPGFFKLAGMRLQAGRDFSWTDGEEAQGVAVISESLSRHLFGSGSAVGSRIDFGGKNGLEVIGVVNSASLWMPESREPMAVYRAFLQEPAFNSSNLDIRIRGNAETVAPAARKVLESMGRHNALRTQTIEDRSDRLLATQRIIAALASFFGGLAMLLAAVGLYGVLSQAVTNRTGEMGIRMAIGARPLDISWLLIKDVMLLVLAGAMAGIVAVLAGGRFLAGSVYGVSPADPILIAGALGILAAVALLAAYIPARRAAALSPTAALRI